jgi:hypothetical protein
VVVDVSSLLQALLRVALGQQWPAFAHRCAGGAVVASALGALVSHLNQWALHPSGSSFKVAAMHNKPLVPTRERLRHSLAAQRRR